MEYNQYFLFMFLFFPIICAILVQPYYIFFLLCLSFFPKLNRVHAKDYRARVVVFHFSSDLFQISSGQCSEKKEKKKAIWTPKIPSVIPSKKLDPYLRSTVSCTP
uniref:Uncharacterized protein n=1 Tax=Cacopsylla melanoneura TaxID=428564 RepID=A0A8D9BVH1_9HEMI